MNCKGRTKRKQDHILQFIVFLLVTVPLEKKCLKAMIIMSGEIFPSAISILVPAGRILRDRTDIPEYNNLNYNPVSP